MFRLYKAELKKIFLKPSIFVVTGLIILMLALSTFLYTPATKDNYENLVDYPAKYNTVGAIYNEFNTGTNFSYNKMALNEKLTLAQEYIDFYTQENTSIDKIVVYIDNIEAKFSSYKESYNTWKAAYDSRQNSSSTDPYRPTETQVNQLFTALEGKKTDFVNSLTALSNYYSSTVAENTDFITVMSTKDLNNKIIKLIADCKDLYSSNQTKTDVHGAVIDQLNTNKFNKTLREYVGQLKPFTPKLDVVNAMPDVIAKAEVRLDEKFQEIHSFVSAKSSSQDSADTKAIESLINDYYLIVSDAYDIVVDGIKISGLSDYGATNITKYYGFENNNLYKMKEELARTKYIFNANSYAYNYADNLNIVQPSNNKINAYDFSYYALRLCTLFITIYIVVLAAGTIAGEQSGGTLKLLAIRPFSRNKLLTSKILATLTIGAILLAVSSVATLVIGGISYGFASANILMVFNATSAFVVNPFIAYLLAIIMMLLEVSFYALLSICISTVFKSNIGAVSVSTLILFVSLVLNVVAVNAPWLRILPFTNISLFKYFGSAFVSYSNANGILQGILTPTVFTGATFWLSFIMLIASYVAVIVSTYVLFKRRDIK